ncbi:MAG TPA: glycosyltransferase family 39 protein [Chitinophagaceae bacterium]|nr:glycosyltransferase family 39 protein [Chitinophagaceae bacterium]
MKQLLAKHHRLLFYGLWLLLGLLQARLTELQDDEAYYWVFSRHLDWGYFDHPPMTALLVKAGYAIFPNELGVRFFPLLLNILSLAIIERLTENKNPFLFYAIALSMAVIQLTGFVAVPDIPLIFFTALFFWCYKKFAAVQSVLNTFLLGLSIAFLLYSKYHAVLIVFFTLLSNLKLFTKYQLYVAGIFSLLLFTPHLWWQYQHDWVSFRYHLFESNVNAYRFSFTSEYVLGQLLIAGPVAGFILLPAAFLYKTKTKTERALCFTLIGIYVFFLLSSFRGKVEGNWTSPALVAVIILAHQFLNEQLQWQKWLYRLLPVTLLLVLFGRVVMIADILPVKAIRQRYHAWKKWPQEMREKTKGLPVVFSNSYQRASKYWFYSGQTTYSLNLYKERRNNYNFWPIEDSLLGKPVYFLDIWDLWRFPDSMKTPIGFVGYKYDSSFISFSKINITPPTRKIRIKENEAVNLTCSIIAPEHYKRFINGSASASDTIRIGIYKAGKWQRDIFTGIVLKEAVEQKNFSITINPALSPGKYFLRFAINHQTYPSTHNSEKIELVVD